jgi:CheY-like chemotaxis protein
VLIVDDDVDVRDSLAELLEGRGWQVSTALHGQDALRVFAEMRTPPSVILLDLMMPVMDGYEFLEQQRKDPALAKIPVAIITASHGIDRARLGDGMPIVRKPFEIPLLMATLERVRARESEQ